MADNTTLPAGTGGDTIRDLARLAGTVKTQVVQLDIGGAAANSEVLVTAGQQTMAASLPVVFASNQTALPVTGTFFQATQPVSNASLPLPTGASTETTLAALNTKVTAVNTGAVVLATGAAVIGAVTQSGAWSVAQSGTWNIGTVTAVTAITNALPAGANSIGTVLGRNYDQAGVGIDSLTAGAGQNGLMIAIGATNYVASTNNSTTVQLAASATFTGVIETVFNEPNASVLLTCDQPGILTIKQYITSAAGTQCVSTAFTTAATAGGNCYARSFTINGNFFNVTFQNTGASTTTTLNLNVAYGQIPPATQLLNQPSAINEINGTVVATGNGVVSAGVQRVAIASDNTAFAVNAAQATAANLNATVVQATPANLQTTATPIALTKGTQGATGFTTQDLKDAGRSVNNLFMVLPIVTTATDALQSLTGFAGTAAVAATTTPAVVTTAKTRRLDSITITYVAIATAGSAKVTLRAQAAGVVTITSPIVAVWVVGGPAAVAGVATTTLIDFPNGMEFAASTGLGVSIVGLGATQVAAAVGYAQVAITGTEY